LYSPCNIQSAASCELFEIVFINELIAAFLN
jgi:hypothetical protein